MISKVDFLPLGSVVVLKGGAQKAVIIARGLVANLTGEPLFFDYGGVLYPQGLVGENILYFNSEDIRKTLHEGYRDDDDDLVVTSIHEWMEVSPFERGNTRKVQEGLQGGEGIGES